MNENTNPEVNSTEEELSAVIEEIEAVAEAEAVEETVSEAESVADETIEETVEAESAEENTGDDMSENPSDAVADNAVEEGIEEAVPAAVEEKPKKKRFIQIPVIISACLVVAALLGYFVFTGFFLREPEGVTWSNEIEGATYYYEFNNDGTFKAYVGSIEVNSTYEKVKSSDGNTLTVNTNIGNFYGSASAAYEITGSRLLGNQTLNCSYGEGYDFTLAQVGKKDIALELPADFTPDEDLLGSWIFRYYGYDIYKATFNEDGTMALEFVQDGLKYNGTYTLEGSTLNFTYYVAESIATPIEYAVDGDTLSFMGYSFVREGSDATVDELSVPQN